MNYLVTCDRFVKDEPGGAYLIAWELARMMRANGHRVALLCGSGKGDPSAGLEVIDGIEVMRYRFPDLPALHPLRWHRHISIARAALSRLDGTWDVVHAHSPIGALASFECLSNARKLYTAHSPAVMEQEITWQNSGVPGHIKRVLGMPLLKRHEASVYQRADSIHVLSRYTAEQLVRLFGPCLAEKLAKVPWWYTPSSAASVDRAEARRRLGWPRDAPIFFTLRRMVARMGLDTLLDAAESIASTHSFHLRLGGAGPLLPELRRRAEAGVLQGRAKFLGRMSDEDVSLAYRAADAFILPTRALECFGIITLEALGAGCPVIASRAGAIPEIMDAILPEWQFEPGNSQELANLLVKFLRDDRCHRPTSTELSAWVSRNYGEVEIQKAYMSLIAANSVEGGSPSECGAAGEMR